MDIVMVAIGDDDGSREDCEQQFRTPQCKQCTEKTDKEFHVRNA